MKKTEEQICCKCEHWNKKKKYTVYAGLNSVYPIFRCNLISGGDKNKIGAVVVSGGKASGKDNPEDYRKATLFTDERWGCVQFKSKK